MWIFIVLFFISLFFEGTVTLFPMSLCLLLLLGITFRNTPVFFLAFLGGLFLDSMFLRPLGLTSVVFILLLFLLFLYERKYEITSVPFVLIASFIASFLYLFIFQNTHIILRSLLAAIVGTGWYIIYKFVTVKNIQKNA